MLYALFFILIFRKGVILMAEYVITDGSRFIYQNHSRKYVPTHCESMADTFSKKQAEAIYNNSLPKALKSVFYVQKLGEDELKKKQIKQVDETDLKNNTEKVMLSENIQKWLDKLSSLNGLVKEASVRKEVLEKQLKDLEDEKIDIEHYIEFSSLNAAQGYKASKELQQCRLKRRHVKNEIFVLDMILKHNMSDSVIEEITEKVKSMDKRTYKPRVRNDLFDL